jgi:uncharacterized protein YfaS (alpha-2-macroglobulin family)
VFNNTSGEKQADVILKLAGQELAQRVTLKRGVSYLPFKLPKFSGAQVARLEVREVANKDAAKNAGKLVDVLETTVSAEPARWRGIVETIHTLDAKSEAIATIPLNLPADARNLDLRLLAGGSEHFLRIADSLIDYPWGCVEQTSSRLIPLSIAAGLLTSGGANQGTDGRLRQMLYSQRLRLAALAGPNAVFGWWGDGSDESLLMTSYAYYADWRAAQTLGLDLPAAHWEHLLEVFRERADKEPLLHRALALWFMQQIGLPVRTQAEGLLAEAGQGVLKSKTDAGNAAGESVLTDTQSERALAYAIVLTRVIAKEAGIKFTLPENNQAAIALLAASRQPAARALLLLAGDADANTDANRILETVSGQTPTLDRALTLVWTQKALGGTLGEALSVTIPAMSRLGEQEGEWQAQAAGTRFGQPLWRWTGKTLPKTLSLKSAEKGKPLTAVLRYEASENADKSKLPVVIKRQLYRLEKQKREENDAEGHARYKAVPVKSGEVLSAQDLYLDEITLKAKGEHHYGIVEAPLPPGASVERSTWGVDLVDGESVAAIERSKAEEQRDRYGVPVEYVGSNPVTLRHLLRVSQTGRFVLPPVRYYRMYQPEQKAYEDGGNKAWQVN